MGMITGQKKNGPELFSTVVSYPHVFLTNKARKNDIIIWLLFVSVVREMPGNLEMETNIY